VKTVAEENNIPLLQPEKLRKNIDFFNTLEQLHLDFIVVVAYGKIVPE
jgi:methionyl-tRNA formyltransferase